MALMLAQNVGKTVRESDIGIILSSSLTFKKTVKNL